MGGCPAASDYVMRRRTLKLATTVVVVVGLTSTVARALSPPRDYLWPSKYENVKEAADVVLAVLTGAGEREGEAEFRVTRSLKGMKHAAFLVAPIGLYPEPARGQTRVLFLWKPMGSYRVPLSTLPPPPS